MPSFPPSSHLSFRHLGDCAKLLFDVSQARGAVVGGAATASASSMANTWAGIVASGDEAAHLPSQGLGQVQDALLQRA